MKYFVTTVLFILINFSSYGQSIPCENPIPGATCNPGAPQPEDGNGSLGMTYNNSACGLNYVQASNMTTLRYTPNPGTGFPTTLNISGIPNCATVIQSYLWWGGSGAAGSGSDPNFTFNGNPYVGNLIGSGPHKCWSFGGTVNYRYDVTAIAAANGAYTFSSAMGDQIDGVTLMIIYTDPNATYEGTIQINDGDITDNSGGVSNATLSGLNVCANSSYGEAFTIVSDMQDNIAPPTHTVTVNGNPTVFPNDFWNFDVSIANYTTGQTNVPFIMAPGGGDCYDWLLMGVYYQTTTCIVCTPPAGMTASSVPVDASCGNCDGTATVNAVGGSTPYTYSWNTVPVQNTQTATNLCPGTYIVTVFDASGCLQVLDTVVINTTIGPSAPVITPAGPFCTTDIPLNLTASSFGGTWSGTGITNTAAGTFDPATAGVGSFQIIYADTGVCSGADTITIVVNSNADATITPVGPYCTGDPATLLVAVSPGGTWIGNGITNATTGAFDPATAGIGTHLISYEISGSCGDTQSVNIVVNPNFDATISPVGPYCPGDPVVTLVGLDPGGTWSGTGITNPVTGTFDPSVAGVGTFSITYSISGTCGDTQTVNIVISLNANAAITPAGPFCSSDPLTTLTAVDPGGIWSGNGITNPVTGTFDPATAGAGTHTITYGIAGACGDSQTVNIIVIPDANATIVPVPSICIADPAFNLTAVDPNGTWTGTGITSAVNGTFDPVAAGVGTHVITYTIAGACGDVQTTTINVIQLDDVTISPVGPFCVDASSVILFAVTPGGVWSGNGITNPATGIFNPATAGAGTHTITYTTSGACGNTSTTNIVVNPLPVVSFSVDTFAMCETPQQAFTFYNTTNPAAGMVGSTLWSFGDGTSSSGDTISHVFPGPGTYDISLTVVSTAAAGSCSNSLTVQNYVQVFADPTADFTMNPNTTNMLSPTIDFYDQSYTNIQAWIWDIGGLDSSTLQNPTYIFPTDTGNYSILLTVIDVNGCMDTTSKMVVIIGEYGIYVPNAFTPDGDGLNDGFFPNGFGITDRNYVFVIFDRWGERIFESHKKFEPWDGTYKGKIVPNGVYVWKLFFRDINNKEHTKIGHVSVVK